jgi:hypothetical protein
MTLVIIVDCPVGYIRSRKTPTMGVIIGRPCYLSPGPLPSQADRQYNMKNKLSYIFHCDIPSSCELTKGAVDTELSNWIFTDKGIFISFLADVLAH